MKLYVVRHAHAGSRSAWDGPDLDRPLSRRGRKEAAAIAADLAAAGIGRLVSSPAVRCVQTLEPVGERLGLPVDVDDRLAEGAGGDAALALALELVKDGPPAAVCSHGDVVGELLGAIGGAGARIEDPLVWPKGSTWVLTRDGGRWAKARYLPPPGV
jgi:8-oxo-dGTP diphosphatase